MTEKITKSDQEWRESLSKEQYEITRQKDTEPPFSGKYCNLKEKGIYKCVCCGNKLFSSDVKYDSGTGWPSFWDVINSENVYTVEDNSTPKFSKPRKRIEVLCSKCDAHLGHVFDDGPETTTGLRYCINSASLDFSNTTQSE